MKTKNNLSAPVFDYKRCTFCGKCAEICPKRIITIADKKIIVDEERCMLCSHCYSVCNANAISIKGLKEPVFKTFGYSAGIVQPGKYKPGELVNLARSRRSIRRYRDKEVKDDIIKDLIEFAVTAPSGSNCQFWEFIVLNGRDKVSGLAGEIGVFFAGLNKLVRNPFLRYLSLLFAGTKLIRYYKNNYQSVEMGLKEAERGNDLLFHGAPALIVIHSGLEGSTPVEDAQYAAYNITLLAHALGLGTCFIGYAVESINRDKRLKKILGIPLENRVHAVLTLGYSSAVFKKQAVRKEYLVRWI